MVASATIHEIVVISFRICKTKKLKFWSIFMQWLEVARQN